MAAPATQPVERSPRLRAARAEAERQQALLAVARRARIPDLDVTVFKDKEVLKPGMFVKAHVDVPKPEAEAKLILVVPQSALQTLEGRTTLFVQAEPGVFEHRFVEVGHSFEGFTEVLAGVKAGDVVVTEGSRAGKIVGTVFEGQRRFSLAVRFGDETARTIAALGNVPVASPGGALVPRACPMCGASARARHTPRAGPRRAYNTASNLA